MPDQQQATTQNLRDVPPPNLGYVKSEEVAFGAGDEMTGSPTPVPEIERPPLRHIDKYIRPECPCLSKRYTVAVLTCVGQFKYQTIHLPKKLQTIYMAPWFSCFEFETF